MKRIQGNQLSHRILRTFTVRRFSYYLDVAVDIQPVVLAGENDAPILHERHVEALSVLHLALQSSEQLPSLKRTSQHSLLSQSWTSEHLIENREVEVVVVVGDGDVPACSHANPDGKVGDAFAADLP